MPDNPNLLYEYYKFPDRLIDLSLECEEKLTGVFRRIDETAFSNQVKVSASFSKHRISSAHLNGTTGYGYGDFGRDDFEKVFAGVFGAEAALVRHSIISGTHALTIGLFALLRPGDILLSVTGTPYDTLEEAIGIRGSAGNGSLIDFGVAYRQVELDQNGGVDYDAVHKSVRESGSRLKAVFIQRSKGYKDRNTLSCAEIGKISALVKSLSGCYVMVDNCYGEFCEATEPTAHGCDLVAGSLIKNPGGGEMRCGGYLAGTAEAVSLAAHRAASPGLGAECGASLDENRHMYKGLFMAPHITAQALKTAAFAAALFEQLGYRVNPAPSGERSDIIQMINLGSEDKLRKFCTAVQAASPVDSHVTPEPWDMPGYPSRVIMASGAFVQGASIEFSADAPLREPYNVYLQGSLTYEAGKLGVMNAAKAMFGI